MIDRITSVDFRNVLQALGFGEFGVLLQRLVPQAMGFAFSNAQGLIVWSSTDGETDPCATAAAWLNQRSPGWAAAGKQVRRHPVAAGRQVMSQTLFDKRQQPLGSLFVLLESESVVNQYSTVVTDALEHVCRCLGREYDLAYELEQVTAELSKRYDELSLLVDSEDNVRYFDEGQNALKKLARNMMKYMDISAVALLTANNHMRVIQIDAEKIPATGTAKLDALFSACYEMVSFRNTTLAINATSASDLQPGIKGSPYKFLCTPVRDQSTDTIGMLLALRGDADEDFSQGDEQLIKVMAHKASRIIQPNYDSLTGMMTRNGFEYHLETALYVVRYKQSPCCVLKIDVDRLQVVNESASHHAGDEVIRRVAELIRKYSGQDDVLARLGGDQFGVLLADCTLERAKKLAEEMRKAINHMEFIWDRRSFELSMSAGLVPLAQDADSIVSIMSAADLSCNAAKELGGNNIYIFTGEDEKLVQRHAEVHWVGQLQSALRDDRFVLFGQRIEPLTDNNARSHVEVLLRLRDGKDGVLRPYEFIPSAERYSLMSLIDRWVLRNTLKMLSIHLPKRALLTSLWAINLSGQSFSDPQFFEFLKREFDQYSIPPNCICFEITETAAIGEIERAIQMMVDLKKLGFKFALDDFGTGLSSFAYLKSLPVDYLKIDGAFVSEVAINKVSEAIVKAVQDIASVMGLKTVAEFVNDQSTMDRLKGLGIDYAQGFCIEPPKPLIEHISEYMPASLAAG